MKQDRAALEDLHCAVIQARDLIERLLSEIFWRALLVEQAHSVVQPGFLERPADRQVARQAAAAIGRRFKGRDCRGPWPSTLRTIRS